MGRCPAVQKGTQHLLPCYRAGAALIARLCQFEHPIDCAREKAALQQASEELVACDGVEPKEALGLARREPKARHFEILAADTVDEVGSWIDGGDNRHGPS